MVVMTTDSEPLPVDLITQNRDKTGYKFQKNAVGSTAPLTSPRGQSICGLAINQICQPRAMKTFAGKVIQDRSSVAKRNWFIGYKMEMSTSAVTVNCAQIMGARRGDKLHYQGNTSENLARMVHESPTTTAHMGILPDFLGSHTLRRNVHVRLGSEPLRLPGGKPICTVSRRQFMKHPG